MPTIVIIGRAAGATDLETLAQRVLTRPVASRHRVVDHHHQWRIFAVGRSERTPLEERQAHGLEVSGRAD
jgi:hypothetical protein